MSRTGVVVNDAPTGIALPQHQREKASGAPPPSAVRSSVKRPVTMANSGVRERACNSENVSLPMCARSGKLRRYRSRIFSVPRETVVPTNAVSGERSYESTKASMFPLFQSSADF